ncbi:MAG: hypothetical protein WC307_06815 [Candidatus Nanoarchaeia archaeon]|jgi:hypothetical protein
MTKDSWTEVMALRRKETRTKGCANTLRRDEVETILATMEFFGADDYLMRQAHLDLTLPRYRVFDWLAMCIDGRRTIGKGHPSNDLPIKVIAHSFLKAQGDIDKFITDLRETDYDLDQSYEAITLHEPAY